MTPDEQKNSEMTPAELAAACSERLHGADQTAAALGIELLESTPGQALMQMRIRKDMLNGHAICHGGMVFTLADTVFAHACNNTNKNTVAAACNIDFLAPAFEGDILSASCRQRSRSGRTGVYDVEIRNQQQQLIALFRGNSYQIKGALIRSGEADER